MNVLLGARPLLGAGRMMRPAAGVLGIGPLEAIFFVLMAGAVVALVVWLLVRKPKPTAAIATAAAAVPDSALAIARERLARGDIDADQYFRIVTALHGAAATEGPVVTSSPVAGTSVEAPSLNG